MADAKTGTVKAVVLTDVYAYLDENGKRVEVEPPEGTSSAKGVEVEVTADEFARGAKMTPPGLAKPKSDEAKAAVAADPAE